jgi:hypothetical protein
MDDVEVAQFVYMLLDNSKLRNVIETMTSRAALILGNFAPERKEVLAALSELAVYLDSAERLVETDLAALGPGGASGEDMTASSSWWRSISTRAHTPARGCT